MWRRGRTAVPLSPHYCSGVLRVPFSDVELIAYLDEALAAERMAAVELELRGSQELRDRLQAVMGRRNAGVHSLGEIWREERVSCPSRDEWGAYLLGVLSPDQEDYYQFHLQTLGCRHCQANVSDLRDQASEETATVRETRRGRYLQSSAGRLKRQDP